MTRKHVNEAVCEALFASSLQPSDPLTAETVADALATTARRLGSAGCSSQMAEEFGNHPEEAAARMRWVRQLTDELSSCMYLPAIPSATIATPGSDLLPVLAAA